MAKRREDHPIQKVTLNLYEGDYARLQAMHPHIGAGRVIRTLVRAYINKVQSAAGTDEEWQTLQNFTPETLSILPERT